MASFGHVAVGLLTGRLHGGEASRRVGRRASWWTLALFAALATLPDFDVLLVAMGTAESGPFGHRGALHSLSMALAVGVGCAICARRWHWPVLRTALAGFAAVVSHLVLDLLGAGGNLPLFWPLSSARHHLPFCLLPDSPRGLEMLSRSGLLEIATEFVLFLPVTLYALWPQLAAGLRRLGAAPLRLGAGTKAGAAATRPIDPAAVEADPSARSTG